MSSSAEILSTQSCNCDHDDDVMVAIVAKTYWQSNGTNGNVIIPRVWYFRRQWRDRSYADALNSVF